MARNPILTKELRESLEDVMSEAISTYSIEFTKGIFPDYLKPQAQDCIANSWARAVRLYEKHTGKPIARSIALQLLEKE